MIRPPQSTGAGDAQLPFDPITVALAVATRWRVAAVILLVAGLAAVVIGLGAGTRVYSAETVLLHRPRPSAWVSSRERGVDSLSLSTKLNLVKVRSNLEELRERLDLEATITQLASSLAVSDQRGTDLLIIGSQWSDPETAQALATEMSDVFLKSQVLIRYREERSIVEQLRREAVDEADRLQAQLDDFGRITSDLQARIARERAESPEDEGLGELSIRIAQLRDAIQDDQSKRANGAMLRQAETQLARVQELHRLGIATDHALEEAEAERDRLQAITVDTDQVAEWRAELSRLQSVVLPSEDKTTASGPLLQAVMFRALEAEFDLAGARERVAQFDAVRDALDAEIEELERYGGEASGGPVPASLAESDFQVVTPARRPVRPSSSNRRLVALSAFILLVALGFATVVGMELANTRVRSGRELALRAGVPVLGVIPADPGSDSPEPADGARLRILAHTLLSEIPAPGARLLVASAEAGEGRTTITVRLARALQELGERVLVVDGARDACGAGDSGLALALAAERSCGAEDAPRGTAFPGVDYLALPGGPVGAHGEPGNARPWARLLEETRDGYRLVLIDGPAVLPDADAQRLAASSDGVLMVTRSHRTPGRKVRTAVSRMADGRSRLAFAVLNETRKPFLHLT